MASSKPIDLLVTCGGCGIENILADYTPDLPAVCSQCRERLIGPDLMKSHKEVVCGDCGMVLLLTQDTEITPGQSTCRCGSSHLLLQDSPTIPLLVQEAEASKNDDNGPVDDGFDWCRPSPKEQISDDYNDIFDNTPE